jgi:Oxidoreductase family, NAD-binding Rossmann fold
MKTLGIGMVGARYGARMHLANYIKLPRGLVELRGVCSRTKESAAAFAQEAQIAFITDDYDAFLARKDIDVVDIRYPHICVSVPNRHLIATGICSSPWLQSALDYPGLHFGQFACGSRCAQALATIW